MAASQVLAALHVPERQREKGGGEKKEEDVEHHVLLRGSPKNDRNVWFG
jgi:hypothetical protein